MSTFAANGACGTCKAFVPAMASSHVSSGSSRRAVSFSGGRSFRTLQGRSYPFDERTADCRALTRTQVGRTKLRTLATGSGLRKRAAGHTAVTASISVPPHLLPMTDHLLVLKSNEEDARQEINRAGGHILHWLGDGVFVATLGEAVDVKSLRTASPLPKDYEGSSATLIQAWKDSTSIGFGDDNVRYWDASLKPPPEGNAEAQSLAGNLASFVKKETKYLTGKIGIVCVMVSGPTAGLTFSKDDIEITYAHIMKGAEFWTKAEPLANIQFVHKVQLVANWAETDKSKAAGKACPTAREYQDQFLVPALAKIAKVGATYKNVAEFLDVIFPEKDTWGYCVFVTKYDLPPECGPVAYAFGVGDDTVVMSYPLGGNWNTPDDLWLILAHESGHVFGAVDEYKVDDSEVDCNCGVDKFSKVAVINGNCANCKNVPQKLCIMKGNSKGWICPYTRGQLGWEWWGYSYPVPLASTGTSPALASDGTLLYLAWKNDATDIDNKVKIKTSSDQGKTWVDYHVDPDVVTSTGTGPRLAFFGNMLYIAFLTPGDTHIRVKRSLPGKPWQDMGSIHARARSDFEPSLAVFKGKDNKDILYMAFRSADGTNEIQMTSLTSNVTTWNAPTTLPGSKTRLAPAICTLPGPRGPTLFLAYQTIKSPSTIEVRTSSNATDFRVAHTATTYHSGKTGPALSALGNGRMYMVFSVAKFGDKFPVADVGPTLARQDDPQKVDDSQRNGPLMYLSSGADNNWDVSGPRFLPEGDPNDSCTDQTPSLVEFGQSGDDYPNGCLLTAFKGVNDKTLNLARMGRAVAY